MQRAGVRRITARHTCGTLLAFLKVHPTVAQATLRHSRISMTIGIYTHAVGDGEREAVAMPAEPLEDPLIRCPQPLMSAANAKDPRPKWTGGLCTGGANRI